jgi:carbon storage regulator
MLTLSRRVGERLLLGDDIQVHVVSIRGGAVKLAVGAPRDLQIRRDGLPAEAAPAPGRCGPAVAR